MSLEKIVRPFQLTDSSPPKPPGLVTTCSQPRTHKVRFGGGGSAKLMFGSETVDETFYSIKKMREKPRQTT